MDERASLESLLIPGASAQTKQHYAALAAQAEEFTLSLLEQEYVILDTETTGFDAKNDALIEVAAAIVKGNQTLEVFSTFVNPQKPIPAHITEITHITDEDVAQAPLAQEVMEDLIAFCGTRQLIAHNASFDQAFIQENCRAITKIDQDEPRPLLNTFPWIDTVELARIGLPLLREHNLQTLSTIFAPDAKSTHRAIDDVIALARVWRVILVALANLPQGLPAYLAGIFPQHDWASRSVFEAVAQYQNTTRSAFSIHEVRDALTKHLREQQKVDADELEGGILSLETLDEDSLSLEYEADGLLGAMYPGYETRHEQLEMAQAVARALNTSSFAAIEAGTGVGKSMAYLLPTTLFAQQNKITCGIATKSNALLDQLIYHELPRLNEALVAQGQRGLEYLSLKGYDHYPCLRKLFKPPPAGKTFKGHPALIAHLISYVCQSVSGDIDAIGVRRGEVPRFEYLASQEDCLGHRCRYYRCCLLHSIRRQAKHADIIVTNHSLLYCDVMSEGSLLPPVRHWVIDEAHGAQEEARRQLSGVLDAKQLTESVRATLKGGGLLESIRNEAAAKDEAGVVTALASKVCSTAEPTDALVSSFFSAVGDLCSLAEESTYNSVELWLNEQVRQSGQWSMVASTGSALATRMEKLVKELRDLISAMGEIQEFAEKQSTLAGHTMTIAASLDTLMLILDGTNTAYVYSALLDRRAHLNTNRLVASYYDVGGVLAEDFYPNQQTVVYTSATIALAKSGKKDEFGEEESSADFGYFMRGVGLDVVDQDRVVTLQLDSSYDFDSNMTVFVPTNMIAPNDYSQKAAYQKQLDDLLFNTHVAMGGSVLTLFTNRKEMEDTFMRLSKAFEEHGLEVVCQFAGTSRTRLREKFVESQALSLFALRSFWEGFDAPGDTLRCVIIPKLPFGRPNDPLMCERNIREERAWMRYSLPEAIISLKQAAGRLIRTSSDSGYLVLADSRLVSKFYGKQFLDALPSRNIHFLSMDAIAQRMEQENAQRSGS